MNQSLGVPAPLRSTKSITYSSRFRDVFRGIASHTLNTLAPLGAHKTINLNEVL